MRILWVVLVCLMGRIILVFSKVAWMFGWNAVLFGDLKGSFLGHAYLIAHMRARWEQRYAQL